MAPPDRAKGPQRTEAARADARGRDKGTRGGRPEAAQPGSQARANGGQVPRPREGGKTTGKQAAPAKQVAPAGPGGVWRGIGRRPVELATGLLSLAGLGVSIYLTVAHYTTSAILACSDKGLVNCAAVTTSPESMVFGIFPVAVLGLAFYVFMAAVNSPWGWRAPWPALRWLRLGSVIVGMIFVLYLIYTELFTLNAICLWCTSVHVITFLLFGVIVFAAASGYGNQRPELAPAA